MKKVVSFALVCAFLIATACTIEKAQKPLDAPEAAFWHPEIARVWHTELAFFFAVVAIRGRRGSEKLSYHRDQAKLGLDNARKTNL
jgi:hypothetical protein